MKKSLLALFCLFAIACARPVKQPGTHPGSYINPIIPGFNPDPSICRVGEDFYLVTSSFEFFPGVPIYHSRDLIHWEHIGYAIHRNEQLNYKGVYISGGIWAPTLRYHNGTFYLITTLQSKSLPKGNFYITAKDIRGPWSDPTWIDESMFDPSLFFDDDGKVFYTRRGNWETGGIMQAQIDITTGKLLGEPKTIDSGMVSFDTEGPHLYKYRGKYYLMCGEGGTRSLHMETIGRSNSPWGPFERCPHNPILANHRAWSEQIHSTGHAELVEATDGSWWMVFLGTRHHNYDALSHMGRETFLAPVQWKDGWPVVNEGHTIQPVMHANLLPSVPVAMDTSMDAFDSGTLALCWNYIRIPEAKFCSLTERPGFLRITGNENNLDSIASPAWIGRRQQHFRCEASTLVDFNPVATNEEAGITAFLTHENHYDLGIREIGGRRQVFLRKRVGDIHENTAQAVLPPGKVALMIQAKEADYRFLYRVEGEPGYHLLGTGKTQYLGSELPDFCFTGTFFAMYATGNGKPSLSAADFDSFLYRATQ